MEDLRDKIGQISILATQLTDADIYMRVSSDMQIVMEIDNVLRYLKSNKRDAIRRGEMV